MYDIENARAGDAGVRGGTTEEYLRNVGRIKSWLELSELTVLGRFSARARMGMGGELAD